MRDGKDAPADAVKDLVLTFDGDKMTFSQRADTKKPATYKLDASQKPAHLDLMPSDGPEKDMVMKMIYQIDGDTLKLAGPAKPDGDRPKGFDDKGIMLMTLKREKK